MSEPAPHLRIVPPPSGEPARTDDDLILLARAGHPTAFDELVRRHQPRVLRVAARCLGQASLAADAAQAAFLEIYRALPRYHPRGAFPSYLYRVLLNQCRMLHRSQRSESRAMEAVSPAEEPIAADEILARERTREVERALRALSPKLRDAVVLRYAGDLSYQEIADTLDVPVGTVKRRLFDSMEKLRVILEEA